ncbi:MAG: phosphoribosylanthranilate isomerase, partial [Pseudomonadales bacterium]|nr:phosphoribosylanthranilate isomerase [Pseudomonadales bacterium]
MNHTRIKICGITRWEDARAAVDTGVDALGFMMYEGSARFVDADVAAGIVGRLPANVHSVGVFVNSPAARVAQLCQQIGFDLLQFHGEEDDEFCARFGCDYIKVIRVAADTDVERAVDTFPGAAAIMFDTDVKGMYGGTGITFDWRRVEGISRKPVVLAGGRADGNVAEAIQTV